MEREHREALETLGEYRRKAPSTEPHETGEPRLKIPVTRSLNIFFFFCRLRTLPHLNQI
jgi:hypothetical protein